MAQNHKVRISHKYKGDLGIIQQEIQQAIKRGLKRIEQKQSENAEYIQNKEIIQRRIQQFFLNCSAQFRNSVEFWKSTEKQVQKVVMEPDSNLQKINDVKMLMLKQVATYSNTENFPQIQVPIEVNLPQKLSVKHCNEYLQEIQELQARYFSSLAGFQNKINNVKNLQKLAISNMKKIQAQQKKDRQQIEKL